MSALWIQSGHRGMSMRTAICHLMSLLDPSKL